MQTGLHDVLVQLHVARKDLVLDVAAAMPYGDSVPEAIFADPTLGGKAQTFQRIDYEFGEMSYGGSPTVGWRWTVVGVKIQA
jgi:hypothetical protein